MKKSSKSLELIVGKNEKGLLWGRAHYEDNLLVASALTLEELKTKMTNVLSDFHDLDKKNIHFHIEYDITALSSALDFLNISALAAKAGINPSLLRQYVTGSKHPSLNRVKKIQRTLQELAQKMKEINLTVIEV